MPSTTEYMREWRDRPGNREKINANARAYYARNSERVKANEAERRGCARVEKRAYIDQVKSVPCMDCGLIFPPYVMDLDHRRGEKLGTITDFLRQRVAWHRLIDEVEKCDVVCANCHRLRHGGRFNG